MNLPRRILIASPVKQKAFILQEFLESLQNLETANLAVDFAFIDDYNEHRLLYAFADKHKNTRIFLPPAASAAAYRCDEITHHWNESLIWRVAEFKDFFIRIAYKENYDFLFLADSDLYLHPRTLIHLVSLEKDIVSEVYWTVWEPGLKPLPQVWLADQYSMYYNSGNSTLTQEEAEEKSRAFLSMLSRPGTYRVGGLGGCTLISRHALEKGISFRRLRNLSLAGEDRHFCIRAEALGLELYADTHFPPFHIYRDSDLANLKKYKQEHCLPSHTSITLAMLVRNEARRYLRQVLQQAALYIDRAVILDDASTDETSALCRECLCAVPLMLVSNPQPGFHNEIALRKQLWEITVSTGPDWIIVLDADELFEEKAPPILKQLAKRSDICYYSFRLYDMWDENHYREDQHWYAHKWHRPLMVRYVPGFSYQWKETPLHCGRIPFNITALPGEKSDLRVKHLGWLKPRDRIEKYYRYQKLDPQGIYGSADQYRSILLPRPRLVRWEE